MKFRLDIDCNNDAFAGTLMRYDVYGEQTELVSILRKVADRIEKDGAPLSYTNVLDSNGNTVGAYRLREED